MALVCIVCWDPKPKGAKKYCTPCAEVIQRQRDVIKARKYRKKHKAHYKQLDRLRLERNREFLNAQSKTYYLNHRDEILQKQRQAYRNRKLALIKTIKQNP